MGLFTFRCKRFSLSTNIMVYHRDFKKNYRVYVANLEKRTDRKKHIVSEFKNREEFEVGIVPSKEMETGAEGLWETFKAILMREAALESDFFIFCEDDHSFTNAYTLVFFEKRMEEAQKLQADVLMGGILPSPRDMINAADLKFGMYERVADRYGVGGKNPYLCANNAHDLHGDRL